MIGDIALAAAVALAAVGAVWDVASRRIPNYLCLALALVAGLAQFLNAGADGLLSSGAHALIVLLVGMALFRIGAIGAGDAKFYTAAALALTLDRALPMLGWTSLAGLVVLVAMAIFYKGLRRVRPDGNVGRWTVPYGLPIAIGFVATLLMDQLG